jgi:hypothetical protein
MSTEFVNAYSDDQIFLHMLDNLISESFTEGSTPTSIVMSSCCRLCSVLTIGGIDTFVINFAKKIPGCEHLADFAKSGNNKIKVANLKKFITESGVTVNNEVFEDYLAIKYIRNAYIHSGWSNDHQAFVRARGFPDNQMNFSLVHFEKIKKTYIDIMNTIGCAVAIKSLTI